MLTTPQHFRIKRLLDKGLSPEEVAHIEGCDVGLVRSVENRADDPNLSPTASREYHGRSKSDEEKLPSDEFYHLRTLKPVKKNG